METLIIIALVVASLIWNAIQKRNQEEEEGKPWLPPMPKRPGPGRPQPPSQPPTQPQPERPGSWEEELRRLLQGEPAEETPPPVIARPVPPPVPPPLPRPIPAAAMPSREGGAEVAEGDFPVAPWLVRSTEAFQRGHQIEAAVAERLRKVDEQLFKHKAGLEQRKASQDISHALGLLRDRPSQRAAIIVSVILGPPRSLES